MSHTAQRAKIEPERLKAIQATLRELGLDGWLLYDYHATNPIAGRVLGLSQPLSRRYFVLIPVEGKPVAVAHSLERPPWKEWRGSVRVYFTWQELEKTLAEILNPGLQIAVEYSAEDRIPQLDRLPAGIYELLNRAGVNLVESRALITRFAASWTDSELTSHRRSARILANVAARAFQRAAQAVKADEKLSEWELKSEIVELCSEAGLVEIDTIVAVGANAADGHYEPTADAAAAIVPDQVLLIDLWAREPGSVFADQTWMGFMGTELPERVRETWKAVHGARQAAVAYASATFADDSKELRGCDVDAAARAVIEDAGFLDRFNHRTGHAIDSEVHGLGPNIDGVETRDERILLPGIAFSIEPGVYHQGEFGIRSEINVYMSPDGPEVTTPNPQDEMYLLLTDGWQSSSNL